MSKTIQAYIDKHPDKFESWHSEGNNERGLDYWVYCKDPYFNPDLEGQTIHEDTVAETLKVMRRVIKGRRDDWHWVANNDIT